VFTGAEACNATMTIRDRRLNVRDGLQSEANLRITADGAKWITFLNNEIALVRALLTRTVRLKGSPQSLSPSANASCLDSAPLAD
jgi:adhesin HecA-like repeat protein